MSDWLGDIPASSTLPVFFRTYDSNGANVTMSGLAVTGIEIYKGASLTQRSSDSGYALLETDGIDIETQTGLHGFSIDLSDNTDAGFYAAGSYYTIVLNGLTVSTQSVGLVVGRFRIVAAETTAGVPAADTTHFGGTAGTFASGIPSVNTAQLGGSTGNLDNLARWAAGMIIGTADSGSTTTMVDAALTTADTDYYKGALIVFTSGTVADQARLITAFDPATDTVTFTPALTQAVSTNSYAIIPWGYVQWNPAWDAEVESEATDALNAYDPPTNAELATEINSVQTDVAAVQTVVDAVLVDTAEIGVAGAGLTNINLPNQTMDITGNITGNLSGSVGSVTGAVGSVTGAVGSVTGAVGSVTGNVSGNVTGSVGSLATQAKADVNAEVVDALNTDTYAEPAQGAPGATISLADKIGFLFKAWRNRTTQTATEYALYNDDATTVDHKATTADDGTTFSRTEIATGP